VWIGDARHGGFCLATEGRGYQYVMDFVRMGMSGAQPRFQVREDGNGLMVPARDLCTFQVGTPGLVGYAAAKADRSVYRYQIDDIDHPDARLIKSAPELLDALKNEHGGCPGYVLETSGHGLDGQGGEPCPTCALIVRAGGRK